VVSGARRTRRAGKFVTRRICRTPTCRNGATPRTSAPRPTCAGGQRRRSLPRRPERWALVELQDEKHDSYFIDGLEAGYVLEDEARHSGKLGSFYVPKKDGWFEHPMNCFEYGVQARWFFTGRYDESLALRNAEAAQRALTQKGQD
jgi:hypothetical protein